MIKNVIAANAILLNAGGKIPANGLVFRLTSNAIHQAVQEGHRLTHLSIGMELTKFLKGSIILVVDHMYIKDTIVKEYVSKFI